MPFHLLVLNRPLAAVSETSPPFHMLSPSMKAHHRSVCAQAVADLFVSTSAVGLVTC